MKAKYKILIVAGEVSGDAHAAKLVESLRNSAPETDFEFFGATSKKLRDAGVEQIVNADEFAVMGLLEIARRLPMFLKALRKLKIDVVNRGADAVILVDFPDFNLKLAKYFKKKGIKVIYYISPQIWAWKKYRLKTIKNHVDLLLTILPFEKDWYRKRGVSHVKFVGHPLAGEVPSDFSKKEFCEKNGLDSEKPIIALLPGSRSTEISRILPLLLETASLMCEKNKELQFLIALAQTRQFEEAEKAKRSVESKGIKLPKNLKAVKNKTREALSAADAAAVTSGTATLETAIIGTPFAIVYKTSTLNAELFRPLVSIEHFGLVNLIAGERLVKEFIQYDFKVKDLAEELFRLLNAEENKKMREKLSDISDKLGDGNASENAAQAILNFLEK